jgi:hypothetical protein
VDELAVGDAEDGVGGGQARVELGRARGRLVDPPRGAHLPGPDRKGRQVAEGGGDGVVALRPVGRVALQALGDRERRLE